MTIRALLTPLLAAGLAFSPIAAQATDRARAPLHKSEGLAANPWVPWVVALAVAVAIIIVIADNNDHAKSP